MEQSTKGYPDNATDNPTSGYDILAPGYYLAQVRIPIEPLHVGYNRMGPIIEVIIQVKSDREWLDFDADQWMRDNYNMWLERCPFKKLNANEIKGRPVYVLGEK